MYKEIYKFVNLGLCHKQMHIFPNKAQQSEPTSHRGQPSRALQKAEKLPQIETH